MNMVRLFADDERGAVTADWVTLTAGILVLGIVVVYSVMGNSAGYLMDEFDNLNKKFEAGAIDLAEASQEASIGR
jgi:hypothetical protein